MKSIAATGPAETGCTKTSIETKNDRDGWMGMGADQEHRLHGRTDFLF